MLFKLFRLHDKDEKIRKIKGKKRKEAVTGTENKIGR